MTRPTVAMQHLLIDTNVLMLLLIGRWDRKSIPSFRRTATFTVDDFDLLQGAIPGMTGS